jgi:hypothetical protein
LYPFGKEVIVSGNRQEENKSFISEIFLFRAHFLFGVLLSLFCEKAMMSYRHLGREAKNYREDLIQQGYTYADKGSIGQVGISQTIAGKRHTSYAQVFIWTKVFRDIFTSDEYKQKCKEVGKEVFVFDKQLEEDFWRLSMHGTPEEIIAAYMRHQYLIDETSPDFIAAYEKHKKALEKQKKTRLDDEE